MKNARYIFIWLLTLASIAGCKKEEYPAPPPPPSPPTFYFNGSIDGKPLNIQAGENNYYMFTSYSLDSGVYSFKGELRDKNCSSNCSNSLRIAIKDYREYTAFPTMIDSSIVP